MRKPKDGVWPRSSASAEERERIDSSSGPTPVDRSASIRAGEGVASREPLYLGLQAGDNYGWGVCSRYLIRELSQMADCRVLSASDGSAHNAHLDGDLFQALTGVDFFPMFATARGRRNFGYTFFENELTAHSLENAGRYDLVLGGSSWCAERMRERGIDNCGVLIQGIDPELFFPFEDDPERDRFVIFSGGKFELRKGQDLVLKAVRILQAKYPDIWLVNCWYNIWPESMRLMERSPHIRFELCPGSYQELMQRTYALNGLDPSRIVTCELLPAALQRELYRNTDIGVFPNRCEGGTNLVLMEYIACGKPVIASFTSGHTDVVNTHNAMLLTELSDWVLTGPERRPFARWQEPSLEELVAAIEFAYHHRDHIKRLGQRAGEEMRGFTWTNSAERLLEAISGGSRNGVDQRPCRPA